VCQVGDSKPGYFAIASPPSPSPIVELLIKHQPGSCAELLCGSAADSEVLSSAAMGKGFQMDKIPALAFPSVLLFATGTGISPVKALIESGSLEQAKRSNVTLYYGTRSAGEHRATSQVPGSLNTSEALSTVSSEPHSVQVRLTQHK
jgi:arabinosyltransferase